MDTYQTLTGLTDGYCTLGVWVRSDGGDVSNTIALTGCGGTRNPTAVPVDSDGAWLKIVTYVDVTNGQCTINLETNGAATDWTDLDDLAAEFGKPVFLAETATRSP